MSIPASAVANVIPGVISAGGSALVLNGVVITDNPRVPIGQVLPFSNDESIGQFFGIDSEEYELGRVYFTGYENSFLLPGNLYFYQYASSAVGAYVRGTSLAAMTLSQLQAITGTLAVTIDGVTKTASSLNLSGATSFSNAATLIATALSLSGGQTIVYDSVSSAFVINSATTGITSTVSAVTGSAAAALGLANGTQSQGAAQTTPAGAMAKITSITRNFATFMTTFEPSLSDKLAFAQWVNGENKKYIYEAWDTDVNASVANNTTSFGAIIEANEYEGTVAIGGDPALATSLGVTLESLVKPIAAFKMGAIASINFDQLNGRPTFAFKRQGGLSPTVADQTKADILMANGYNFYGAYATANDDFVFYYPGTISGAFRFEDGFVNQIWMNSNFQLALIQLAISLPSVPYNAEGRSLIMAALADPIQRAKDFGAIRSGVTLSAIQAAQVNSSAGVKISDTIYNNGWFLQVRDPGASARVNRTSPSITFWYTDGGSVHKFTVASIEIQ